MNWLLRRRHSEMGWCAASVSACDPSAMVLGESLLRMMSCLGDILGSMQICWPTLNELRSNLHVVMCGVALGALSQKHVATSIHKVSEHSMSVGWGSYGHRSFSRTQTNDKTLSKYIWICIIFIEVAIICKMIIFSLSTLHSSPTLNFLSFRN